MRAFEVSDFSFKCSKIDAIKRHIYFPCFEWFRCFWGLTGKSGSFGSGEREDATGLLN